MELYRNTMSGIGLSNWRYQKMRQSVSLWRIKSVDGLIFQASEFREDNV